MPQPSKFERLTGDVQETIKHGLLEWFDSFVLVACDEQGTVWTLEDMPTPRDLGALRDATRRWLREEQAPLPVVQLGGECDCDDAEGIDA